MKKHLIAGATLVALTVAATSCSDPVNNKALSNGTDVNGQKYEAKIVEMGNSVAEIMGTFQGSNDMHAFEQNYMPLLRAQLDPYHAEHFDQKAFMEGMRTAMMADTTDFSFRYGYQQGLMLRQQLDNMGKMYDIPLSPAVYYDAYAKALKDTLTDEQTEKLQQQASELDMELQARRQEVERMRIEKARAANTAAAKAKKEELKTEGYKELPSGIMYKVTKEGAGAKVTRDDVVSMNYVGKHINGEVFDSTDGKPIESPVRQFVPGYQEALQLIGKGGKVIVYIPGELAYGELGQPRAGIGPNEMLMFEIEVTDIKPVVKDIDKDATEAIANASPEVQAAAAIAAQRR